VTVRSVALSAAVGAVVLVIGACSDDGRPGSSAGSSTSGPAFAGTGAPVTAPPGLPAATSVPVATEAAERKLSGSVLEVGASVASAIKGGEDPSHLSSSLVHVRADGSVELVIRSAATVAAEQQADLQRFGVEVTRIRPELIQAWVPYDHIAEVAALPWVSSVSAPSYATVGG
jgi:hypothetical protein